MPGPYGDMQQMNRAALQTTRANMKTSKMAEGNEQLDYSEDWPLIMFPSVLC
jgi:hypothetical protein